MNTNFHQYKKIRILVMLSLLLAVLSIVPATVGAEGASLSIYPQSGSFTVGSTFDASVFLNTGGENVNAVKVDLKFDPSKLQVITPAKGLSAVTGWTFPPSFSNTAGTISLQGGFSPQGINTSEGLVSVIVFEAISPGSIEVSFLESSKALLADEKGTDILSSTNRAIYEIIPVPSKGPRIFSETHPDQNKWYKNNTPSFSWEKAEGAEGFSFRMDDDPNGEPDNITDTTSTAVSFEGVKNGVSFFHLKVKKEGVWGGTSNFKIMIDNEPPAVFLPRLESFNFDAGKFLLIYYQTLDSLSEIDHYEARVDDFSDPQNVVSSAWIRQESPFRLTSERPGTFEILIRAFDKAGNFREGKVKIKTLNSFLVLTGGGIAMVGVFLLWWQLFSLIFMILLVISLLTLWSSKKKKEDSGVDLPKEIKEAEKEIEDVKRIEEKLRKMRLVEEEAKEQWQRLKQNLDSQTKP